MMKLTLTTTCALLITLSAHSQSPDKALAKVRYTFTHVNDTTQRDKPYTENMVLLAGKNASLYTSYDKIQRNINNRKQLEEQIKNAGSPTRQGFSITMPGGPRKPVSPINYYFFAKEHKLITSENLVNTYLIEEPVENINWKISGDTSSFSGVHCQKATADFKGRHWTAWFAGELPFQSGPWKLNGLPGLIIEAYDDKKEVQFQFAGIEDVPQDAPADNSFSKTQIMGLDEDLGSVVKLPFNSIKTTRKELDKLKEAMAKDPQGFLNAQFAARGGMPAMSSVKVTTSSTNSNAKAATPRAKMIINNPIELPGK